MQRELFVCNIGNTPTFAPLREVRNTIIDITNRKVYEWVEGWHVNKDHMLSDHRMIRYVCKTVETGAEEVMIRSYRKANWEKFQLSLTRLKIDLRKGTDPEALAEEIVENLQIALDALTRRKTLSSGTWWTAKLAKRRRELKKELGKAREIRKARIEY